MPMKRNLQLSLALLVAILAVGAIRSFGQQSATTPSAPEQASSDRSKQNLCAVAGTVVRASTGEPLKKARIFVYSRNSRSGDDSSGRFVAISDATGHFAFDDLPPGRYDMDVDRTGFVSQRYGQDQPGKPGATLTLAPGQKMTDLLFRLQTAGVIAGHVTDEDGEPAQGVDIQVQRRTYSGQGARVNTWGNSQTNDLGEYRVFGLEPGRYYILATWNEQQFAYDRAKLASASRAEASLGYVPTYYPGTTDASRAVLVQVSAGAEVPSVDFVLTRSRTYSVRGRVSKAVGDPSLEGVFVNMLPRSDDFASSTFWRIVDSKTGNFEISGVASGSYTLAAMSRKDGMTRQSSLPVDIANADVDNVSIVIGPGVDISGRVTIEGTLNTAETLRVSLSSRQVMFSPMAPSGGELKADGSFVLSGISDGSYFVSVMSGCRTCYVKSATLNGQDILEKGIQISSGASPGTVEIVYSALTGTVSGAVSRDDGLPAAGALVVLVPDPPYRGTPGRYRTGSTDQYGAFMIEGVPPGSFKAFAWDKMDGSEYEDPEFLKGFEDKGKSFAVEASSKGTTQLKLLSSASGTDQ